MVKDFYYGQMVNGHKYRQSVCKPAVAVMMWCFTLFLAYFLPTLRLSGFEQFLAYSLPISHLNITCRQAVGFRTVGGLLPTSIASEWF